MKDFYYWYPELQPSGDIIAQKYLLVKKEDDVLVYKFNLSMMGVEHINTYEELKKVFPNSHDYNTGELL